MNIMTTKLSTLLLALALAGCATNPMDGVPIDEDEAPDNVAPGEGNGEDEDPATPAVQPSSIELTIIPSRGVYELGVLVQLQASVLDVNGATIEEPDIDWTASPEGAAEVTSPGLFMPTQEGHITLQGCTTAVPDLCDSVNIFVDAGPPILEVLSPAPASEIDGTESATITVAGRAENTQGTTQVFLNGRAITIDADGNFSEELTPVAGINHIELVATDGLWEEVDRQEMDVLWAPGFAPTLPDSTSILLHDAIRLRLGQEFFDDREAPDTSVEDTVIASDLVDAVAVLVDKADVSGQIENPVVDNPTMQLEINGPVITRDPEVTIDLLNDGFEVFIHFPALLFGTVGELTFEGEEVNLAALIAPEVSLVVQVSLEDTEDGYDFVVEDAQASMTVPENAMLFADEVAQALFNVATSLLRTTINETLENDVLIPLSNDVADAMVDALADLDEALTGASFPLDTGFGEPIPFSFSSSIASLDSTVLDRLDASFDAVVGTEMAPQFSETRGVALIQGEPNAQFRDEPAAAGVRLALLNAVLHSFWNSGGLSVVVDEPLPGLEIDARLPPVLHPPRSGEPYDLMITFGQLELTLPLPDAPVTLGVHLQAGLTITFEGDNLAVTISEPTVSAWQVSAAASPVLTPEVIEIAIAQQMWPSIASSLEESLSFPIPVPELTALQSIAPDLGGTTLGIEQSGELETRTGYLMLGLSVEAVFGPEPEPIVLPYDPYPVEIDITPTPVTFPSRP